MNGNIKSCFQDVVKKVDEKKILEDICEKEYEKIYADFLKGHIDLLKYFIEENKKIPDKIEKRLAKNPFIPQIRIINSKNQESCSICWRDIPEINNDITNENENNDDENEYVICDNDKIICVDCVINLISNSVCSDSYINENKVPGFNCPFYAEDKIKHEHRYNVPSLGLLLSQIIQENKIIELHEVISESISKYLQEQIDKGVRDISKEICKDDTGSEEYITKKIKNEFLIDVCPNCKLQSQSIEGCMSMLCKNENGMGCNKYYCSVCLEYYNNSKFCTDEHIEKCIKNNNLKGDYRRYFNTYSGHDWRLFQRVNKISKYFSENNFGIIENKIIKKLYNDPELVGLQLYLKIVFPNYVI
jgi:hypothetical protein